MKLVIDTEAKSISFPDEGSRSIPLYSREGFERLSNLWLKVGWNEKYVYTFSWLGRPIIQLPEDVLRIQEVIYTVKPDVIIETGVAHGGSLILYASLFRTMGRGRVIGIDVEIRPHNRKAIESHELADLITLIEGDSTDPGIVKQVENSIPSHEKVLVILDSNHTKRHVLAELKAYGPLVTPGSYIVATDGSMEFLDDVPRGQAGWATDNPKAAAEEFAAATADFFLEEPAWLFNEGNVTDRVTHWPGAFLRRK